MDEISLRPSKQNFQLHLSTLYFGGKGGSHFNVTPGPSKRNDISSINSRRKWSVAPSTNTMLGFSVSFKIAFWCVKNKILDVFCTLWVIFVSMAESDQRPNVSPANFCTHFTHTTWSSYTSQTLRFVTFIFLRLTNWQRMEILHRQETHLVLNLRHCNWKMNRKVKDQEYAAGKRTCTTPHCLLRHHTVSYVHLGEI